MDDDLLQAEFAEWWANLPNNFDWVAPVPPPRSGRGRPKATRNTRLSPLQKKAAAIEADASPRTLSSAQIALKLGCSSQAIRKFRRQPHYQAEKGRILSLEICRRLDQDQVPPPPIRSVASKRAELDVFTRDNWTGPVSVCGRDFQTREEYREFLLAEGLSPAREGYCNR